MENKISGCFICGKSLKYFKPAKTFSCAVCQKTFESEVACEDGHFVCNDCHAQKGIAAITFYALNSRSKDPVLIAFEMMKSPAVNMHGPEHHYLVPAALLAAYRNSGGNIDLNESLATARQRAKNVPGGICGFWGSCGAAIGTGIFVSVATKATPLSENEWSLANRMTAQSLNDISKNGGPRCCKRDSCLAVLQAVRFSEEHLGVFMEKPERIQCEFYMNNKECKKEKCIFYAGFPKYPSD
ncbi:DUF5714 domain-containing protein [Methanolapillus millepedarum]|uniref:DUF5714 domain-containing protein n=1 Tax=Methanolapillus millepedarum TaxID=3028296 RepID=A0AA96VB57_9EURY|nr:hypothetical protein MsAc7_04300 [Methanosarcinaceae archaeon Ac7]